MNRPQRPSTPFVGWRELAADALLIAALAGGMGMAVDRGTQRIPPELVSSDAATDAWFDADLPRLSTVMSERWHRFGDTTRRHPLLPLLTVPPVKALQAWFGYDPLKAVRVLTTAVAGAWITAFFLILRLIGCRRFDAALFSLLAAVSAGAVFWFVVPETWPLGSLTILLALLTVAASRWDRRVPRWWQVALQIATVGVTMTNWMAGCLATCATASRRRAARVFATAAVLVVLLWCAQRVMVPQSEFFNRPVASEFLFEPESGGPRQIVGAFLFHGMAMPRLHQLPASPPQWARLSVQRSLPGSGTPWGMAAVGLWAALLGLGGWAAVRARRHRALTVVLGLILLGQLVVHLIFGGREVFLFSLHWMPLLIVLAAFSTLERVRPAALALAAALVVCTSVNNARQFRRALAFVRHHADTVEAAERAAGPMLAATGGEPVEGGGELSSEGSQP